MSFLFSRTVAVVFFSTTLLAQSPSPSDSVTTPVVVQDSQTPAISALESASVRLPAGQRIELVLKTRLSSDTSKVGDVVELEVVRPLKAEGLIVIAQDTAATAKVVIAEPRRRKGVAGKLAIAFDSVQLVSGDRVALSGSEERLGKDARQEINANMGEWTVQTLGFGAPLAPLFLLQKGGRAEVEPGTRLSAYAATEVVLDRGVLERHQPVQAKEVAVVYVFGAWHPTCGSQELPYDDSLKSVVRVDLPPGEYWFHNGASIGIFRAVMVGSVTGLTMGAVAPEPIKVGKVLKRPLREFATLEVQGGHTYYLRSQPIDRKFGLQQLESLEGEKLLAENDAAYLRVRDVTPEMLQNLSARPKSASPKK